MIERPSVPFDLLTVTSVQVAGIGIGSLSSACVGAGVFAYRPVSLADYAVSNRWCRRRPTTMVRCPPEKRFDLIG